MKILVMLTDKESKMVDIIRTKINSENLKEVNDFYKAQNIDKEVTVVSLDQGKNYLHEVVEVLILNGAEVKRDSSYAFTIGFKGCPRFVVDVDGMFLLGEILDIFEKDTVTVYDSSESRLKRLRHVIPSIESETPLRANQDILDIYNLKNLGEFKVVAERNGYQKIYEGTTPKGHKWRLDTRDPFGESNFKKI